MGVPRTNRNIAGVILAGGLSRRMGGGDKGLLPLGGRPLLAHVAERLAPQVGRLVLNANGEPARFAGLGLPVIPDTIPDFAGPLAGVLAGLEWAGADTGCKAVVTVAGDTPLFPDDLVAELATAASRGVGAVAVAASAGRRHPTFAFWPLRLRDDLRQFLAKGERKVSAFMERHPFAEVNFPMARMPGGQEIDPFFNVNTPDDLGRAESMLQEARP